MASDDYITESTDESAAHNYVLISVPHGSDTFYYDGGSTSRSMTSFLRIGAVNGDDPTKEGGWELAKLVVGFNDDTRTRPGDEHESSGTIADAIAKSGSQLASDVQEGMRAFYGNDTTLSADQLLRVRESMKMHYRGGWRDHSAGNRISTTQGDKVELVRGNYKMVVMGRRPDESNAKGAAKENGDYAKTPVDSVDNSIATFDVSGGHVQEWNMSPGQVTEITWVKNETGGDGGGSSSAVPPDTAAGYYTWKTVEETIKGDVDSTYYGAVNELYLGPVVKRTIGWENAPSEDTGERSADDASDESIPQLYRDYPALSRQNPIVTEHTWAKEIEDYRGSGDCRVHRIREETHVDRISSHVHASDIWVETHAKQYIEDVYTDYHSSSFHGGDFREAWWGHFGELFLGTCETFKIGGAFVDVRLAGKIVELNASLPGSVVELKLALRVAELALASTKWEVFVGGTKMDVNLASEVDHYTWGSETTLTAGPSFWKALCAFIL